MEYTNKLKSFALKQGADLVKVADIASLEGLKTIPTDLFSQFSHAISIAVQVPIAVFEMISDQPTPLYGSVYQTINRLLDEISFKTSRMLQTDGFLSLLLITPQYGSRVRLVTVLVNVPLISDKPVKNRCGSCMAFLYNLRGLTDHISPPGSKVLCSPIDFQNML